MENPWPKVYQRAWSHKQWTFWYLLQSIWKQFVGKHSGLRITVRDDSVHKGLRRRIVLAQGLCWKKLQNQTWRGRRFWTNHPIMPRIHTFVSKPTIQSTCSNSWRNSFRTSYWSSDRENSWHLWTCNRNSISKQSQTDILCSGIQWKVSIHGRIAHSQCRPQSLQRGITLWPWESRRKRTLLGAQVRLASRKLVRTLSAFLPAKRLWSQKEPFLRRRRSGKLFLPIHRGFPKWLRDWVRHYDPEER